MSFLFSVIFFTFFLLFRCSDGLTLRPIYSHIDKRLIGEAPRGFGAKDFFLDRSQESPASRSDGVSIHLLSYLLFTILATHKELSNFTHDRLSKCNHIDLEIAELKASLTVKQSNQLVPQAIFDKIKDLCIKLSVVIKQDALTILAALTFLEQLLKKSNVILSQAIEILENIKNLL